ncbi:MAG: amidohydrolase family protein, partial [Nitrospira sp.]|nr:amidohydrolase family protein [Nitrospira sp.]
MMNRSILFATLLTASLLPCAASAQHADTIYTGGTIITMNDDAPSAEAIAIKDGKILAVGNEATIMTSRGGATHVIDLANKTLLPGFVDARSHFSLVGLQAISANLLPAPDGPVNSIPQLQQAMREFIATSPIVKAFGVAIGFNYDDSQLAEQRSPTAAELDEVSRDIPLLVMHQSGHLGVYNSAALAKVGITSATVDPDGGLIRRKPGSTEPDGVLEENAHFVSMFKVLPRFTP